MAKDVIRGLDNQRKRQELPVSKATTTLWMAHIDFPASEATAFGERPDEALTALIASWQDACKSWGRGDPNLIHEYRESITLVAFAPGEGYVKGVTDNRWYKQSEDPQDSAFDAIFERTLAPTDDGPAPGRR